MQVVVGKSLRSAFTASSLTSVILCGCSLLLASSFTTQFNVNSMNGAGTSGPAQAIEDEIAHLERQLAIAKARLNNAHKIPPPSPHTEKLIESYGKTDRPIREVLQTHEADNKQ